MIKTIPLLIFIVSFLARPSLSHLVSNIVRSEKTGNVMSIEDRKEWRNIMQTKVLRIGRDPQH